MIVLLAVGPPIALIVGGTAQLDVTLGTGEVLLVPLAAEGIHNFGQDRLVARCTHSCNWVREREREKDVFI